jgi:probable phosphoglycerate mutase
MEANKLQGSINSHLSTAGKREAEQTAQALADVQFDTVLCSPQGRAKETANIICAVKNNEIQIINDLREIDFGWIEGSTQLKPPSKDAGLIERLHLLFRVFIAQLSGESFRRVKKRGEKCWQEISSLYPEGTILVVAHGVILTQIIQYALHRDIVDPENPVYLKPCNITEIIFRDESEAEVIRLNDTDHLKK